MSLLRDSSFYVFIYKSGKLGDLIDYHNQLSNGDCLILLESISEISVDLIVTLPRHADQRIDIFSCMRTG
jgi:hypothetical protein